MHSVDLLIEALNKYEGSYILVSHDRYFVNKTANKIWEIEDFKIKEFVGTYDEWERWKQERNAAGNSSIAKKKEPVSVEKKVEPKPNNRTSENREQQKELQKLKKQFEQLEERITKVTEEKKQLAATLTMPDIYSDHQKFPEAEKKHNQKKEQLYNANAEYEKLFEKMMTMEQDA